MQTSQKQYADRQQRDHSVAVGDQVLLDTRNLNLSHLTSKLRPRFCGPFLVEAQFQGRQLPPPPPVLIQDEPEYEVERVLTHLRRGGKTLEFLLRWKGYDPTEDSWVAEADMGNARRALKNYLVKQGGPAPSGVSQVDPLPGPAPVQVAVDSGAARGAASGGAEHGGAKSEGSGSGGAGGAGAGGAGAGGAGAGGAGARGAGAGARGSGAVLGVPSSPDQSQTPLQPASPLPAPPYTEKTGGLTKRREPAFRPASPVRTSRRVPCLRPPPVPGTHAMALCPSSVPLRVPLSPPPEFSLPTLPDPDFDHARAANPTVSRLVATVVTDPSFESTAASALVAELDKFAAAYRLDYATALVAESDSASPLSVGGECALGTDVLEDRVKRPSGSPPAFKARYVARGFSQRQGVDYF
ncbi:unnamed protein product [Closterium sp. NIES-53]